MSGNTEKSDNLPDNAAYFGAFAELQFMAVKSLHNFPDKEKWGDLFESYSSELSLDVISRIPDEEALRGALSAVIGPLISIAGSRDFSANWKFPLT